MIDMSLLPEAFEREADDLEAYPEDEEDLVEEVKGGHCTAACQHASKIECVCGCGGRNHGIKAIVKLDAFLTV